MATNPSPSGEVMCCLSPSPQGKRGAGLIARSPWDPWTRLSCTKGCHPPLHASWTSCLHLVSTSELTVVLGDMPHMLPFVTQPPSLRLVVRKSGRSFLCEYDRPPASVARQQSRTTWPRLTWGAAGHVQ